MTNTHKRWGLGAALILGAASLLAATTPMASASPPPNACTQQPRVGHIAGIVPAVGNCPVTNAPALKASDPAKGTPPLIFHGGSVMMTPSTSPLVITPIFWSPPGSAMSLSYKALITLYLTDVSLSSGQNSNVFSVLN